jgi:DNA-binding transcriptional regulator YiaG
VTELRQVRCDAALSQRQCAELLHVPVNTLRMWDSGLRRTPADIVSRLRIAVEKGGALD